MAAPRRWRQRAPACDDPTVSAELLERGAALEALESALVDAQAGAGSVVLLCGEAGIGKTSVVRAFHRRTRGRARVLVGACDDLLTPRTLGPLHDVVSSVPGGPLAAALRLGRDEVLTAVQDELSDPRLPTVLVVEDAHWADEATLDVLRYIGRRIADLPAVLLVTYRDNEVGGGPLLRFLGGLSGGAARRVTLSPLSREAVADWAGGTNLTTSNLYRLTRGNPFFVSEVLAGPAATVPPTVVDAVLARVRRLEPATQQQLHQLAVVPSQVELPLARRLVGDIGELGEAERHGILEVRARAVAFRHELARRAVEDSLPVSSGSGSTNGCWRRCSSRPSPTWREWCTTPCRPVTTRRSSRTPRPRPAGGGRRSPAPGGRPLREGPRRHRLLGGEEHAATAEAYGWTLYHCDRVREGVVAATDAVRLREGLGDTEALAHALASLSVQQWSALHTGEALASGERAVRLLEDRGDSPQRIYALTFLGTLLVNIDRERDALAALDAALEMTERTGFRRYEAVIRIFRGRASMQLGEPPGLVEADRGLELARAEADHQSVMMAYLNIVVGLWMVGRRDRWWRYLDGGAAYGRDREFHTLDGGRESYRHRLQILHGAWDQGEAGMRAILGGSEVENGLDRFAVPELARLAARRGGADAGTLLASARRIADRAWRLHTSVTTTLAELEHAWAGGRTGAAEATASAKALLPRLERVGHERNRGELLRWLRRVGAPVAGFDGCPEEFAAGLRGDWRRPPRPGSRSESPTSARSSWPSPTRWAR